MAEATCVSPLFRHPPAGPAEGYCIAISELADRAMIDLRGQPGDDGFMQTVNAALGFDLPGEPRTSAGRGDVTALWLSVDQWLIVAPGDQRDRLVAALEDATADRFALACDMSQARAAFRLEGDGVREVLMKGTSVDLTQPEYGPGSVRRLLFAEIAALVHFVSDEPRTIDLYVFRSYAHYAWDWLRATAGERAQVRLFGVQQPPRV